MIEKIWNSSPGFYRTGLARVAGIRNATDSDLTCRKFTTREGEYALGKDLKNDLRRLDNVFLPISLALAALRIIA